MNEKSIGLIELSSIAAGFAVADAMLKAANIQLILSRSICSGKYMVWVGRSKCCAQWRRV
jgi:microcompartment protein CcmL/EutN